MQRFVSAQPRGGRYDARRSASARGNTNRASIRWSGPATTQRVQRDRSRGGQPHDLLAISGPSRTWRGERGSPGRAGAGAQATPAERGRMSGARRCPRRRQSIPSLRANARVQLQRIPIRVRAKRAQSIAPLAAATHVGQQARRCPRDGSCARNSNSSCSRPMGPFRPRRTRVAVDSIRTAERITN